MSDEIEKKKDAELEKVMQEVEDEDIEGYQKDNIIIPFASIRQKDVKEQKKVIIPAGSIKFNDGRKDYPKISNSTILFSQIARVYFEKLGDRQPACKSFDGMYSVDGHACVKCEHFPFGKKCNELRNLLIYDLDEKEFFIMTLNPSGIKAWRQIYTAVKKKEIPPPHFFIWEISTEEVQEPALHYIPVFTRMELLDKITREEIKKIRHALKDQFTMSITKTEVIVKDGEVEVEQKAKEDENQTKLKEELKKLQENLSEKENRAVDERMEETNDINSAIELAKFFAG